MEVVDFNNNSSSSSESDNNSDNFSDPSDSLTCNSLDNNINCYSDIQDSILEVRHKFLEESHLHPDLYDEEDRLRVKISDLWVGRFLNFLNQGPDKALEHMKECFQWRKSFGVNHYDPFEIPLEVYQMCPLFEYLPDSEGRGMLYARIKMHRKLPQLEDRIKKFFLNHVERMDARYGREFGFNVVFDMTSSGIPNADLDMLFFILPSIRKYFPNGVKHVYILGLPWILNSIARFALAIIPSDTAKKVKFLSQEEFHSHVPSNRIPDFLGGTCKAKYRRVPQGAKDCIQLGRELYGMTEEEVLKLLKPSLKFIEEGRPLSVEVDFDERDISSNL